MLLPKLAKGKKNDADYWNKAKQKESESMGQQSLLGKCYEPTYVNQEGRSHGML